MKRFSLLIFLAAGALAQPAGVHTVYILPMSGGLDQYLADWLTREHVLQVVTDPRAADAVITDRLGEAFEQKMSEIRPADKEGKAGKEMDQAGTLHNSFRTSGARGTVFLVDAKSHAVLWSDHEKPPSYASDRNMNHEAERIVKKLREKPTS